MKTISSPSLVLGTIAILFSLSCQRQEQPVSPADNGQKVVITEISGAFMDEPETKTTFEDGNVAHGSALHINWSAADMVNVWFNTTAADIPFTSTNTAPASSVSFSGSLSVLTGTGEDGSDTADYMYGYYPYSEENTISNGVITAKLPSIQEAVANNIANNLNPWAARSTNWALKFYNVGCWFRFKVSRNDIRYVEFSGNKGEKIAGTYSVGFDANGIPTITDRSNGTTTIRLNAPGNGTFATDTWYYIALLPTEFTEGFSLIARTETKEGYYEYYYPANFNRGSYSSYSSMGNSMEFYTPPYFTVNSSGKKVLFSPSNLVYLPYFDIVPEYSSWFFAQAAGYDECFMGGDYNSNISSTYTGYLDLFGWGTSGHTFTSGYGTSYQGWSASTTDTDYGPIGYKNLTGAYANGDWGVEHGERLGNPGWRTLTDDEWAYVAMSSKAGLGSVNGTNGMILVPDVFEDPNTNFGSEPFSGGEYYNSNSYSGNDWEDMKSRGAVFLPAAGQRNGTTVSDVDDAGYYWSSTNAGSDRACIMYFVDGFVHNTTQKRSTGCSVRLVKDF